MISGDSHQRSPMLIVGFNQFLDFYPSLIADNLNAQYLYASDIMLDLPSLRDRRFVSSMTLARLFDTPEFRQEVIKILKPKLGSVTRVGFPAVLGVKHPLDVKMDLESSLGVPVFEIPGLPPSIPGIRLHNLLINSIERNHGHVFNGMQVIGASIENDHIESILSEAASRQVSHRATKYVLATGGILGGGTVTSFDGHAHEIIFGLPIHIPESREQWFANEFLSNAGHPIHKTGLRVDSSFRPIDLENNVLFPNLLVVGNSLDSCDPIRELSMEGIALASAYKVGKSLSQQDSR